MSCINPADFGEYYAENMHALGLNTPKGMYENFQLALGNASLMLGAISTAGKGATMTELALATFKAEKVAVSLGLGAAGYVGASIGSMAVASGRVLGCGSRIADMFSFTRQYNLQFEGQNQFYQRYPEIFDNDHPRRRTFGLRLKANPQAFESIS